jgi:pimeloyl-ACP methyl ester carboxylesterase
MKLREIFFVPLLIILCSTVALPQKGFAKVNGTSLYYEMKGKGPALVLISGGGLMDRRAWDEQFDVFSKRFKVIRYDIRGIGKSARPTAPFSHSDDLFALLKLLKIKKTHVIGLSFGGGLAIDFALDHPEMVDRIVVAASGTSTDAKSDANLQGLGMLAGIAKKDGIAKMTELVLTNTWFISSDQESHRRIAEIYSDNHDVFESNFPLIHLWQPTTPPASDRLQTIQAPTLVLIAEKDNPAYKSISEKLTRIPYAKTVVIAGSGHVINLDKPKEFNDVVLQFLEQ